jgi:ABC-type transporter Mla maintaining outer membrane lipid asymmetry ATPase subunit MlaF
MTEFVDQMLLDIVRKNNLTAVMVSHNLASIFRMADSVAVLHDGKILAHDTPEAIRSSRVPEVEALVGKASRATIDQAHVTTRSEGENVVEFSQVEKKFGIRKVLREVNFTARKNEITVIIGGSGAGKSVMIKHILGLMRPDVGTVKLFGREVSQLSDKDLGESRRRIGMLFQHAALLDSLTVEENIAFPLYERREASRKEALERAHELLKVWQLEDVALSYPSEISNGQQKRVALARALISRPELMVYDEPTTGQDPILSDYVEEMILKAQELYKLTSIVISHDMASTMRMADQVAMLYEGQILLQATPAEFLASEDQRIVDFVYASSIRASKDSA